MRTVTSADGTEIAYELHGSGPPLVLLHGGSGSRENWAGLRPHLETEFTLVLPDRRGRGDSGGHAEYGLDREIADLRALLDAVDGDPAVFGHSFGGLVALAAAETLPIDRLLLYEPALLVGEHRGDDLAARMQERLDAGRRREAMRLFYEESSDIPDVEALPWWPEEVHFGRTETVVRENREVEAFELPTEPEVDARTLLLTGEHGPAHLQDAVFTLRDRLSDARLVELDGVGHVAPMTAPERVAEAVRGFVGRAEPPRSNSV